jgi:hypothetical protein
MDTKTDPDGRVRITIRVPEDLRIRAKLTAVRRKETLQDLMERALVTELECCEREAETEPAAPASPYKRPVPVRDAAPG